MNDEQLLGKVGSWLKDTDTARPDVERITERAMSQVPQVRQRGRWWPLPMFDDGSQPERASGSTVFSACKFVTAGVIVGLLGGFLLAGILVTPQAEEAPAAVTEPPSLMTTERLRSIAQTVEVEPGVLRVDEDGVRDLASAGNIGLVSGRDGGIWLLSDDRFVRIGTEGTHAWPPGHAESASDFGVAPGGTVWTVGVGEDGLSTIQSFGGEGWTPAGPSSDVRAIEIAPDGTVWAMWQDTVSEMVGLGYLVAGDLEIVGEWPAGELYDGHLYLSDAGELWVTGAPQYRAGKPQLYSFVDGALQRQYEGVAAAADVGPDGTVWLVSLDELVRLDGTTDGAGPESWALPETMTVEWGDPSGWGFLPGEAFRAAPDGSVWFALRADSGPPLSEVQCGGAARFDGTTWLGPILPGMCVESIDLAADGSVWLLAHDAESDDGLVDLFVVTSDAADAA